MTPLYLSEPEAWREIARRIAEGEWSDLGLCAELRSLSDAGRIDLAAYGSAYGRLRAHLASARRTGHTWSSLRHKYDGGGAWAFPIGGADERVLAALFLALEAESEAP